MTNLKDFELIKIDFNASLLIIKGTRGFLACSYINVETANKVKDACALVRGVKTFEDMLKAEVFAVSEEGEKLGLRVGMLGAEALEVIK